jgi:hypothetical protein
VGRLVRPSGGDEPVCRPSDTFVWLAIHPLLYVEGTIAQFDRDASLIENWIDESERRAWFLSETTRER